MTNKEIAFFNFIALLINITYFWRKVNNVHHRVITFAIQKLANEAVRLGLPDPPKDYIDLVQCPAGVRYGQIPVSVDEALLAHHITLELCEVISRSLGKTLNRNMPVVPEPIFDGMTLTEFLKKYAA